MKTHTTAGATILGGSNSELLRLGEEIAISLNGEPEVVGIHFGRGPT